MTDRELLQQALDALISVWNSDRTTRQVETIQAIKARLAQPEKEWANLTVEEIDKVFLDLRVKTMGITKTEDMVRAIETKLKEKNT